MMRAPASGFFPAYRARRAMRPGHLVLGQPDLLASPVREVQIGHFVRTTAGLLCGVERVDLLGQNSCHSNLLSLVIG